MHRTVSGRALMLAVASATVLILVASPGAHAQCVEGDVNDDGVVNGIDLAFVLANWGDSGQGDVNGDGIVDGVELSYVLTNWGEVCPPPKYGPIIDYLPQAYGVAWPPASGTYVEGVEVGDSYSGTVTLSPTTGTTGLTFAIDGMPTGVLTVAASQVAPIVNAPGGFSLGDPSSRRRTVSITATNGSSNEVHVETVDFGWRWVMFSQPHSTVMTASTLEVAMQSASSNHRIESRPNETLNNNGIVPVNIYTFAVPAGAPVNRIYFAHTVSGQVDSYGWTPTFTEPFFFHAVSVWDLVGTFTADPGDGVAKSYRVWRQSSLWGPGDVMTQGVR